MKIEAKHLELGEKIAKIAILAGMFFWVFQGVLSVPFSIVIAIFGMITILAYGLKMFITKGETILKLIIIFGGLVFLFLTALAAVILGGTRIYISMMILSFLLIALLIFELVTKKSLDKYEKYITLFMIFIFGLIIGGGVNFGAFGIVAEILVVVGFALLVAVFYFKGTTSSE